MKKALIILFIALLPISCGLGILTTANSKKLSKIKPYSFSAKKLSETSVQLTWDLKDPGEPLKFELTYFTSYASWNTPAVIETKSLSPVTSPCQIEGLDLSKRYEFHLWYRDKTGYQYHEACQFPPLK